MRRFVVNRVEYVLAVQLQVLFALLGALSIFVFYKEELYIALFFAAIFFLTIILEKGIILDLKKGEKKNYHGVLFLKFGVWKSLSQPESLLIRLVSKVTINNLPYGGAQTYSTKNHVALFLKTKNVKPLLLFKGSYDSVVEKAKIVSEAFSIKITDHAGAEMLSVPLDIGHPPGAND
jgi:hypothetical protein